MYNTLLERNLVSVKWLKRLVSNREIIGTMRGIDILASFELEINKLDNSLEKPVTDDSLYWINQAVVRFVKDRFNGNAPKRTSYE
jgi:hypothetical protein